MKKLVFGSLNIDRTYRISHFVQAGETLSAESLKIFCGGKGFNQAVALSRAGNEVYFAGAVGSDGKILMAALQDEGIRSEHVIEMQGFTGHAVIQVNGEGQNCIIVFPGTNGQIEKNMVDKVLADFSAGDLIVLQNEISNIDYIIHRAHEKGMIVAFNPSPFDKRAADCDFHCVDYLLVNEVEGGMISGESSCENILCAIRQRYPRLNILLTLGEDGSAYLDREGNQTNCGIYRVQAVDTTAAGDTYTGYFLSEILKDTPAQQAMRTAAVASGISVSRHGASPSIPKYDEVKQMMASVSV